MAEGGPGSARPGGGRGGGRGAGLGDGPEPVTVTLLVTDVVGSTALRAEIGEARADELARAHEAQLRACVTSHGGRVVKGTGDGVMATFGSATTGLAAAVEVGHTLDAANALAPGVERLEVRVGLAAGDVTWHEGDCQGLPAVEAARLAAAAEPGQVLCTDLVVALAHSRGGHQLSLVGDLDLKGLPGPVKVWAVRQPRPVGFPLPHDLALAAARRMVGRDAELDVLDEGLRRSRPGRAGFLWLSGEPGIGKTRLAAELALRAHGRGAIVLFGRCDEDVAAPYQPFVEALRATAGEAADDELATLLGPAAPELCLLAPELAPRVGTSPAELHPGSDQHRLIDAVRAWLSALSERADVVLVVDDVHWASSSTGRLLVHLARSPVAGRVMVACTARDTEPDEDDDVRRLVGELERHGDLHRARLVGLDQAALAQLLGDEAQAAVVLAETAGNPLYVGVVAAGGGNGGRGGGVAGPAGLVRRRVAALGTAVHELLAVAAVAGLEASLPVVARAAALDELEALERLEAAGRAGIVHEAGADRFAFAHGVVRRALLDELSASRRARLHARLADAFAVVDRGDVLAVAHHLIEAGPAADPARTSAAAEAAARHSDALFDHDQAARLYRAAADLAPHDRRWCALRIAQGNALRRASRFPTAWATLAEAAEVALANGFHDLAADAACAHEEASWLPGRPGGPSSDLLRRAFEGVGGDPRRRALVEAHLGRALAFTGEHRLGRDACERAVHLARSSAGPEVLGGALYCLLIILMSEGELELSTTLAPELEAAAKLADEPDLTIRALNARSFVAARTPAADGGRAVAAAYRQASNAFHDSFHSWAVSSFDIYLALLAGDLACAEVLVQEAGGVGTPVDEDGVYVEPDGLYGLRMFLLRREQDQLGTAVPAVDRMLRVVPDSGLWAPGLALLLADLGRLDEARTRLRSSAAGDFARLPRDSNRVLSLGLLAEACVLVGDAEVAGQLGLALEGYQSTNLVLVGSGTWLGPADRLLGLLAITAGEHERGVGLLEAALAQSRRIEAPIFVARTLCDLAEHAGRPEGLAEAAAIAERHDLPQLRRRARELRDRQARAPG